MKRFGPVWKIAAAAAALVTLRLLIIWAVVAHDHAGDLCQWDCHWYMRVVRGGYNLAPILVRGHWQGSWAFFPAFPLAAAGIARLSGLSAVTSGMVVSTLALLGFLVVGAVYRMQTRTGTGPALWLLVAITWPYGLYYTVPYTESLYAFLTIVCLLGLTNRRVWVFAGASGVLTATRPTGVLLAAWFGAQHLWTAMRSRNGLLFVRHLPAMLLSVAGLVAFMAYLWLRMGDALAFMHIQSSWGHSLRNPFSVVWDAASSIDLQGHHVGLFYNAAWAVIGCAATLFLVRRGRGVEAWVLGATVFSALASGVVWSMPRYVGANPVFLFVVADLVEAIPSRLIRSALVTILGGIQIVFLRAWLHEAAFLM